MEKLSFRRRFYDKGLKTLLYVCAGLTCALLLFLIGYIFYRGLGNITWELLSSETSYLNDTVGILPNILNTLYIIITGICSVALPFRSRRKISTPSMSGSIISKSTKSGVRAEIASKKSVPDSKPQVSYPLFFSAYKINLRMLASSSTTAIRLMYGFLSLSAVKRGMLLANYSCFPFASSDVCSPVIE